jgi:hypothetical protein
LKPTPAGQALIQALAAADAQQAPHVVLPILLASSNAPVVADFSQGKQVNVSVRCNISGVQMASRDYNGFVVLTCSACTTVVMLP